MVVTCFCGLYRAMFPNLLKIAEYLPIKSMEYHFYLEAKFVLSLKCWKFSFFLVGGALVFPGRVVGNYW